MGPKIPLICNDHLILTSNSIEQDNIRRKKIAIDNGLNENSTWNDIANYHAERQRKELIEKFDLHEAATWKDISEFYNNKERINAAVKKGLPETATWDKINNTII